jgi:hypothetical protein
MSLLLRGMMEASTPRWIWYLLLDGMDIKALNIAGL